MIFGHCNINNFITASTLEEQLIQCKDKIITFYNDLDETENCRLQLSNRKLKCLLGNQFTIEDCDAISEDEIYFMTGEILQGIYRIENLKQCMKTKNL